MLASFLKAVLPRAGNYALFTLANKQHVWADSVDNLVRKIETRHDEQGVYFATAAFNAPTSRTAANVGFLRALRLDVDAGPTKFARNPEGAYPTQRDALVAVVGFAKAASLVPSFIVSSGMGLHVYFALAEDATPDTWGPLAHRLGELAREHGLKADPTVTEDTARILRPPGTLHPSGKRVSILKATGKVYDVEELRLALGAPTPEADPFAGAKKYDVSINSDVTRTEGPPKSVIKIVANCGAMREAATVRGDIPEPYWRAMLGICKFTVEGLDMAHEMSNGHPDYDPSATERKFNSYEAGPTSCAEFAKHTRACETCPHKGKIKSPISLGYMTEAAIAELPPELQPAEPTPPPPSGQPWDGCLPPRFQVVGTPGKYVLQYTMKVTKEDETGAPITSNVVVPVTSDIFWLGHWAEAADSKDLAQVTVHLWSGGVIKTYLMDQSLAAGMFDLLKWLAGKGIHRSTDKKAGQAMQDYVTLQLQRIKANAKRPKIAERFGLRIEGNDLVCAQGNHVIYPSGIVQEAMLSEVLKDHANNFKVPLPPNSTGEWGPEVWPDYIMPLAKEYAQYMKGAYGAPGLEKYQLAAMIGLASPFMAFVTGSYSSGLDLPGNGLSVSLYSKESGQGKTALVQAIMLAFGNPAMLVKDSNQAGATDIGRLARLSVWGTFPNSMEEMGQTKETSITNMISAVANAGGKTRGTQSGGFTSSKSWALINLITTNRSQRDMVSAAQKDSPAIQNRLLELDVGDVKFSRSDRDSFSDAWAGVAHTQGAMGAVINYEACKLGHATLNKTLVACVKKADSLLQADQGARFQYRALGALLCLQIILKRVGLDMFDEAVLVAEFRKAHSSGATYVAENVMPTDGVTLLGMCLSDLKPHMLITEHETNRSIDKTKYDVAVNGARTPDTVHARHITSTAITYLSSQALRDWAIENKVNDRDIVNDCKDAGILMPPDLTKPTLFTAQMDLFKGTREANAVRTRCVKIDTAVLGVTYGADDPATEEGKP